MEGSCRSSLSASGKLKLNSCLEEGRTQARESEIDSHPLEVVQTVGLLAFENTDLRGS